MLNEKIIIPGSNVVCCITWEVEGIRQTGCPKKTDGIVLMMIWKV